MAGEMVPSLEWFIYAFVRKEAVTFVVAIRLFEILPQHSIVSVLEELKVLKETTGRRRDRAFTYNGYLDLLRVGTEVS